MRERRKPIVSAQVYIYRTRVTKDEGYKRARGRGLPLERERKRERERERERANVELKVIRQECPPP